MVLAVVLLADSARRAGEASRSRTNLASKSLDESATAIAMIGTVDGDMARGRSHHGLERDVPEPSVTGYWVTAVSCGMTRKHRESRYKPMSGSTSSPCCATVCALNASKSNATATAQQQQPAASRGQTERISKHDYFRNMTTVNNDQLFCQEPALLH